MADLDITKAAITGISTAMNSIERVAYARAKDGNPDRQRELLIAELEKIRTALCLPVAIYDCGPGSSSVKIVFSPPVYREPSPYFGG